MGPTARHSSTPPRTRGDDWTVGQERVRGGKQDGTGEPEGGGIKSERRGEARTMLAWRWVKSSSRRKAGIPSTAFSK